MADKDCLILTPDDLEDIDLVARIRTNRASELGLQDFYDPGEDRQFLEWEAAAGELAVAVTYGLTINNAADPKWSPNGVKAPDLAGNVEIRHTHWETSRCCGGPHLIVRPRRDVTPGRVFLLVSGLFPYYTMRGWTTRERAMQDGTAKWDGSIWVCKKRLDEMESLPLA